MNTLSFAFSPALSPRRVAIIILAGVMAIAALTVGRAYMSLLDSASDRVVDLNASFKAAPDLATLKNDSDLVIVGRVVGNGATRFVQQTGNTGKTAPAPAAVQLDPKKADAQKLQPAAPDAPTTSTLGNANLGTPMTTFTVQVERSVKGAAAGQITVTQLGGKVTLDTYPGGPKLQRTVQFEGDTLMQPGERSVMFLKKGADGSFSVASGPQGRLSIDNTGKVHPVDENAPALKAHTGTTLEGFLSEVDAAK